MKTFASLVAGVALTLALSAFAACSKPEPSAGAKGDTLMSEAQRNAHQLSRAELRVLGMT